MKRIILFAAVPALMMLNHAAFAQSSVTLYGIIDEGFDFTTNAGGHRAYQMVSGETVGSRWGIKGTEDLGGGLSALFQLENGFNVNNGALNQGGREFGRQAYVGLASTQYGTVTMGRQYDATQDMWSGFTAAGNTIGDLAAHPFDNDNADWDYRTNNSVKYVSPAFRGFQAEAMYAFSNQAGGFATNRSYSAAATYALGEFSAAIAYMRTDGAGTTATGAVGTDTVFTAGKQQNMDAALKWTFSSGSNVALAYSHVDVYDPVANGYADTSGRDWHSWKFDNVELNGQYFIRPDLWLAGAYTFTHAELSAASGSYAPNWHQVSAMLEYAFSKRTFVYVQGAYIHTNSSTGTGFDNPIIVGAAAASSSPNQMVYRLAVTHRF